MPAISPSKVYLIAGIPITWKERLSQESWCFLACNGLALRMYYQDIPYRHTIIQSILVLDLRSDFIMLGSPTPVGKRPDFKQAQSGGMGWPRLVPVKDQQAQKTPAIDTSQTRRSSEPPSVNDTNDNAISPTTADEPTSGPPDSAQPPDLSPAGASLPGTLPPTTPAPVEDPQSENAGGNILSSIGAYIANQAQDILKPEEGESSAQSV